MTEEKRKERIAWLVSHAPALTQEDLREVNRQYTSYLFRKNKTGELWTSCCGQEMILPKNHPLRTVPHEKEPYVGMYHVEKHEGVMHPCPCCGKPGWVKELGRTGRRDNLFDCRQCIVLKAERGALWGIGIHSEKCYATVGLLGSAVDCLTSLPSYTVSRIWRFAPGKAEYVGRDWWNYQVGGGKWNRYEVLTKKDLPLKSGWKFTDGFSYCSKYGTSYHLIGADTAAMQSRLTKYIWPTRPKNTLSAMRYLALCSLYPRQAEMLQKGGKAEIVDEMVRGFTNYPAIRWNGSTVQEMLGLDGKTAKEWLRSGGGAWTLKMYKYLRRRKPATMESIGHLEKMGGKYAAETALKLCGKYGLSVDKLSNYLQNGGRTEPATTKDVTVSLWNDTVDAAEKLGIDLQNEINLLPRDLRGKHDEWTAALREVLKERREAEERKKQEAEDSAARKRLKTLSKRYTFSTERYVIRPPISAQEIVKEGQALRHCVAGYAARHAEGSTTILLLRDKNRPGVPLATIEMHGKNIVQVHGYKNEMGKCPENPTCMPARELYKDILDPWLAWLENGSKREKKKSTRRKTA